LTHCQEETVFCCEVFVLTLVDLIKNGDPEKSFKMADSIVQSSNKENFKQ
jgi:hypothetical protein